MKYIRKYNSNESIKKFEHYDTEDLKSRFEMQELQDLIDYKSIVCNPSGLDKETDFAVMHDKLATHHPFLEQCVDSRSTNCGARDDGDMFKYWFDNGDWFVGFSVEKKSTGIYDCSIMFKGSDVKATDDNMIIINGPYKDDKYYKDRVMIEDYEGVSFKEMIDGVIGTGVVDLLQDLGMSDILDNKLATELNQTYRN